VLRYKALGLSEQQFIEEHMTSFRLSVYAVKSARAGNKALSPIGRVSMDNITRFFDVSRGESEGGGGGGGSLASRLVIVDRMGQLGASFASMETLALQSQSSQVEFAHYSMHGNLHLPLILNPLVSPCMPRMSDTGLTVLDLHEINKQFAARQKRPFNEREAQAMLVELLQYLEKLNMLGFEERVSVPPPPPPPPPGQSDDGTQQGRGSGSGSNREKRGFKVQSMSETFRSSKPGSAGGVSQNGREMAHPSNAAPLSRNPPTGGVGVGVGAAGSAGSGATAPTAASSPTAAPSARPTESIQQQTERMRALGFPEELIEDVIASEQDRFEAVSAVQGQVRSEREEVAAAAADKTGGNLGAGVGESEKKGNSGPPVMREVEVRASLVGAGTATATATATATTTASADGRIPTASVSEQATVQKVKNIVELLKAANAQKNERTGGAHEVPFSHTSSSSSSSSSEPATSGGLSAGAGTGAGLGAGTESGGGKKSSLDAIRALKLEGIRDSPEKPSTATAFASSSQGLAGMVLDGGLKFKNMEKDRKASVVTTGTGSVLNGQEGKGLGGPDRKEASAASGPGFGFGLSEASKPENKVAAAQQFAQQAQSAVKLPAEVQSEPVLRKSHRSLACITG
jgi:hypothetical protein